MNIILSSRAYSQNTLNREKLFYRQNTVEYVYHLMTCICCKMYQKAILLLCKYHRICSYKLKKYRYINMWV